jgi:serine/threonine protein kinase
MPLYQGELLETRLSRSAALGLEEGRNITVKLARGVAALHRASIIHRDIKPDNVILEGSGSLKLIDLGVVRVPGLEDFPPEEIPGTRAYMAPEMFEGEPGNEATDIYALGVTMFRAFTGEFPYGNLDATSPPRRNRPKDFSALRPDLPAWLQAALTRAIAIDPAKRFHDRVRVRDGGRTGARPDRKSPAAHALRARPAPSLARRRRSVGACAASVVAGALSLSATA